MTHTKVIDFEILYLFNKFKFYCFLSGTSANFVIDHARDLVHSGDVLSPSDRENLEKLYLHFPYSKPFLRDLVMELLAVILDLMSFDNTNSRYIINCLNYRAKKKRLTDRVIDILTDQTYKYKYFFTLTFNNRYVSLQSETRHTYIRKFLSQECKNTRYICNVDKGKKNKRVHYHGILATDMTEDDLKDSYKKFGFSHWQLLGDDSKDDSQILANYINKLVNHSYKNGTLEENVIFSRRKRKVG